MTAAQALAVRMSSLLLAGVAAQQRPAGVAGVVEWFGAMQAQDNASAMWSLGSRLPQLTSVEITEALERREAIRTWPMRGTVHLVPPRDARWMLDLMGVRALAGAAARREFLGLSQADADRAVEVLREALTGGGRLTRAGCIAALSDAGIAGAGQLGYHLLWYASQQGATCIAPTVGKEQTFVLLDEWVPDPWRPEREEALATMAVRYFRSHGPTTRQDFAGWTGLTATDAKLGIAVAGDRLMRVEVAGQEMLLDAEVVDQVPGPPGAGDGVLALAGFDEYLLGFKDRSWMLAPEHRQAIIPGANGIFQWTIVRDGRVIGTWRRRRLTRSIVVEVTPLVPLTAADRDRVEAALVPYGRFAQSPVDVRWS